MLSSMLLYHVGIINMSLYLLLSRIEMKTVSARCVSDKQFASPKLDTRRFSIYLVFCFIIVFSRTKN